MPTRTTDYKSQNATPIIEATIALMNKAIDSERETTIETLRAIVNKETGKLNPSANITPVSGDPLNPHSMLTYENSASSSLSKLNALARHCFELSDHKDSTNKNDSAALLVRTCAALCLQRHHALGHTKDEVNTNIAKMKKQLDGQFELASTTTVTAGSVAFIPALALKLGGETVHAASWLIGCIPVIGLATEPARKLVIKPFKSRTTDKAFETSRLIVTGSLWSKIGYLNRADLWKMVEDITALEVLHQDAAKHPHVAAGIEAKATAAKPETRPEPSTNVIKF
ncbi:MAG: hypothetical protein P1U40_13790 [Coxiellaceae bacterium]|nr:hypothetical protein [Coxiellaceae bacterium]